ncbi:uncharacterized protein CLUP02_17631 [Colletotrichum lupini]|uniref:Uncharacterized protein n=1 Tax=Colletotrichum lupini TaxID=145971 RepID=A0A9Q8SFN1_9PEZI|nr:uncharacterized protein CLUP02_17631 [Colletotrichum lupini]UQC76120.1 hypothetical protein CLUP02_17631 [Colletotrichum lupini]
MEKRRTASPDERRNIHYHYFTIASIIYKYCIGGFRLHDRKWSKGRDTKVNIRYTHTKQSTLYQNQTQHRSEEKEHRRHCTKAKHRMAGYASLGRMSLPRGGTLDMTRHTASIHEAHIMIIPSTPKHLLFYDTPQTSLSYMLQGPSSRRKGGLTPAPDGKLVNIPARTCTRWAKCTSVLLSIEGGVSLYHPSSLCTLRNWRLEVGIHSQPLDYALISDSTS